MRTANVCALVTSLLIISGCATNNGTLSGNGWGSNSTAGCQDGTCGQENGFGNRFQRPLFGRHEDSQGSGCAQGDCSSGNCPSGNCSAGNCGTEHSLSDTGFDCGPMCGAHLSDEHFSDPTTCDSCEVGPSYVKNQLHGLGHWFGETRVGTKVAKRPFRHGKSCHGSSCGTCDECATSGHFVRGTCKGLGRVVGCIGCGECGHGNAVGLNHSGTAAPMAGMNNSNSAAPFAGIHKKCCCIGCLSKGRLGACRFAGSSHPYGGEIPHTASAADGAGAGADSSAPSYAYPYYTTRGPRDFLQDGCGPPPIVSSQPRPLCLPTIGR